MKINPGGRLELSEIVGRDLLVSELRHVLEAQSVVLVAERRLGKTHVLEKLVAESPKKHLMLKRDVEGIRTTEEFVQYVMADLHPHLNAGTKFRDWLQGLAGEAGGMQIGPIKLPNFPAKHWKQVLRDAIAHVEEIPEVNSITFLWDELPWMLQNISRTDAGEAMELLDLLRSLRQEHKKLRMVFTGSIGLHHVIRKLKEKGYTNSPTNDMAVVEVPPLNPQDATYLARNLFIDNNLIAQAETVFSDVATAVDSVPYYVHHVVSDLKKIVVKNTGICSADVVAAVEGAIKSPHDPWHLKHYQDRTTEYYGQDAGPCLALLDAVAFADEGLPLQAAINGPSAGYPNTTKEEWLKLITLLQRDYYLVRAEGTGYLQFKFSIVKRWWRWNRGLEQ